MATLNRVCLWEQSHAQITPQSSQNAWVVSKETILLVQYRGPCGCVWMCVSLLTRSVCFLLAHVEECREQCQVFGYEIHSPHALCSSACNLTWIYSPPKFCHRFTRLHVVPNLTDCRMFSRMFTLLFSMQWWGGFYNHIYLCFSFSLVCMSGSCFHRSHHNCDLCNWLVCVCVCVCVCARACEWVQIRWFSIIVFIFSLSFNTHVNTLKHTLRSACPLRIGEIFTLMQRNGPFYTWSVHFKAPLMNMCWIWSHGFSLSAAGLFSTRQRWSMVVYSSQQISF